MPQARRQHGRPWEAHPESELSASSPLALTDVADANNGRNPAFSHDGRWLVGCSDSTIWLRDTTTSAAPATIVTSPPGMWMTAVSISPNGSWIAYEQTEKIGLDYRWDVLMIPRPMT